MHDGRFVTLEEVSSSTIKVASRNPHLDNAMVPLNLTPEEKKDLVEYLQALNGEDTKWIFRVNFPNKAHSTG